MTVIAIAVADLHLSLTPPVARSVETDWLEVQGRVVEQLHDLADKHEAPILMAGDVFDRSNAPPELVNWAIRNLPPMIAVPGQHDLPLHRYEDVGKSAYETLVLAGTIQNATDSPWISKKAHVNGFPWGKEPCGLEGRGDYPEGSDIQIALCHRYVWVKGKCYPGAPPDAALGFCRGLLAGYDFAVFGDNHQPFTAKLDVKNDKGKIQCNIVNCGCLIQRKQNERDIKPAAWLLYEDGQIEPHYLDTSKDKWLDPEDEPEQLPLDARLDEFLEQLGVVEMESLDFREAVNRYLTDNKGVDGRTKRILLEAME